MRSAIMPGWGELTLQKKDKAEVFFLIEGGLWLLYGSFNYYGRRTNLNAHSYAVKRASANPSRKDEDYLNSVEDFMNSDEYNEFIEREASTLYPDDLIRQQEYIQHNGYFGVDAWAWSSRDDLLIYWEKRKSAREAIRNASFCIGLTLLNRISSIIDVAFFTPRESKFGIKATPNEIGVIYKF